jgi:hypothetical protein
VIHEEFRSSSAAPLRWPSVAAIAAALACVTFLLALSVAGVHTHVGSPPATRAASAAVGAIALATFALALVLAAVVLFLLGPARRAKDEFEYILERPPVPLRERLLLAAIVLAAFAAPVVALLTLRSSHSAPNREVGVPSVPSSQTQQNSSVQGAAGVHVHWLLFVALAGVALVCVLLLAALRRRRPLAVERRSLLAAAVSAGLDDLEQERDPRQAVLKAYGRMEGALAAFGLPRRSFEAPVEYLTRTLQQLPPGLPSVQRLTALFERAKFSQHATTEQMRQEAIAALADLQRRLDDDQ